jgi:hypothetical protein
MGPSGEIAVMSLGLLPRTGSVMSEAIRREEEQLMENRFILSEVRLMVCGQRYCGLKMTFSS